VKAWHVLAIAHQGQTSRIHATVWSGHPNEEDLEHLALDKTLPEDRLKIESHLRHCAECQRSFEEARIGANRLRELLLSQGKQDQRIAVRYKVRESALITQCNPPEFVPEIGQVMDVSATGLRVRLVRTIPRGAEVHVHVQNAAVFGTVRYCRAVARNLHDVGLVIDQVVMRPGSSPLSSANGATEQDRSARSPQPTTTTTSNPIDILLVEDNPADVKLVKFMFKDLQVAHRITVVADGAQAVGRLFDPAIPKPELILLDLNLPKLSGLEVLRRLREDRTMASLTVAVLSSSTADLDVLRTTALGIHAYLPKPDNILQYEDLRHSLSALVSDIGH
jgi:chemotaxis family two-component system response regulator Rcp1